MNPKLATESPCTDKSIKPYKLTVSKEQREAINLDVIVEDLQRLFPRACRPPIKWNHSRHPFMVNKSRRINLVTLSRGAVMLHPVLAHPAIPPDMLICAVYHGLLMHYAAQAQRKPPGDPYRHPALAQWVEDQLRLYPPAEFWGMFCAKFWHWAPPHLQTV